MYKKLKPHQSILKAYLREQVEEQDLQSFRKSMQHLLESIKTDESEEFNKNLVIKFLNESLYKDYLVNTYNKTDLAIYSKTDNTHNSPLVLFEFKGPNRPDMVTKENLKEKSFYQLILYYIQEEERNKNTNITHLVITDCWRYFIFEKKIFYQLFGSNKRFVKDVLDAENRGESTDFIYHKIIKPRVEQIEEKLQFTYLDLRDFEKEAESTIFTNKQFTAAYKLLSPTHLLRLPFKSDHNTLNDNFYKELLYIMGVEEIDEGKIHKIKRLKTGRQSYSLVEQAYSELEDYPGMNDDEHRFETALGLVLTWINRILFLKLLESQLISFSNGSDSAKFMDKHHISDYDALHDLFMKVLAKPVDERSEDMVRQFPNVPYLNSSLFERSELETNYLTLQNIRLEKMTVFDKTILKDERGRKITGQMSSLEYLLAFLDAYDFGSGHNPESSDVRKTSKTLIDASVLGLVFENINGYKDGSFFTPGYITQYICQETIRKAVVDKFNAVKGWDCADFEELRNQIECRKLDVRNEANEIINSLKICDPSVGSGHFLVSALNELIAIKSDLGILQDRQAKPTRINQYEIRVEADELVIFDESGNTFKYIKPTLERLDTANQRIQESLFEEKRTIIENCLFGVDLNPKSVEICRLRLWIELLKNAYYYRDDKERLQLQTLPNIDINIKSGNSLIHRFDLTDSISQVLKSAGITIAEYRNAVAEYKNAHSKTEKRHLEELIAKIKDTLTTKIEQKDPKLIRLRRLKKDLADLQESDLFASEWTAKQLSEKHKKEKKLIADIKKLETYINEVESNKAYIGAFEWRIEFPEILNDEGDFMGFDCVIGNPPYIGAADQGANSALEIQRNTLKRMPHYTSLFQKWDLYVPFLELGIKHLCHDKGICAMIIPYPFTNQLYAQKMRRVLLKDYDVFEIVDLNGTKIFENATVSNCIPFIQKSPTKGTSWISNISKDLSITKVFEQPHEQLIQDPKTYVWNLTQTERKTDRHEDLPILGDICYISYGLRLNSNEKTAKGEFKKLDLISEVEDRIHCRKLIEGKDIERYRIKKIHFVEWNTDRCPARLVRPTFKEFYDCPKLFCNYLGNLACVIDYNNNFIHTHLLTGVVLWKDLQGIENKSIAASIKKYAKKSRFQMEQLSATIDLRYLLGIMNSKYAITLLANIRGGDYHIYPEYIRNIPIPMASEEQQKPIIELVDKILEAKKIHLQADTKDYENQIDKLVYHLYGLTYDEIKVIDPETPVTREEYKHNKLYL